MQPSHKRSAADRGRSTCRRAGAADASGSLTTFGKLLDRILRKIWHSLQVFLVRDLLKVDRSVLCVGSRVGRDLTGLDHRLENLVAALVDLVGIFERIIAIWAANDAGDKSRLRQSQLRNILSEICIRRFADAIDRNARLLAEIDLIRVKREDLLL